MQIDLTEKKPTQELDAGIDYTKRIFAALKLKVKEHNALGGDKVTFNQLKAVFIEGSKEKEEGQTLPLCGFARVNMFLRLFKSSSIAHEFKENGVIKYTSKSCLFDFSNFISPSKEDFSSASVDVEKYNLAFDVKSVDELYLESYAHLPWGEYL
jgi:hypothetical protein